jgi:hypothetical protein
MMVLVAFSNTISSEELDLAGTTNQNCRQTDLVWNKFIARLPLPFLMTSLDCKRK